MRVALWTIFLAVFVIGTAPTAPSAGELTQITTRGRALYLYDASAAVATDAVTHKFGTNVPLPAAERMLYIGRPSAAGWIFDFGALSADRRTFTIVYRAVESAPNSHTFNASQLSGPTSQGDDFDLAAARAIELAMANFAFNTTVRYNYAALQRADGAWYVYLYPGYTSYANPEFGADGRFTISADGTHVLDAHRMHNDLIDESGNLPAQDRMVAGMHTDVVDDVPEDSDVFHVLLRQPRMPDYVGASGHMYRINTDGSIDDLGVIAH